MTYAAMFSYEDDTWNCILIVNQTVFHAFGRTSEDALSQALNDAEKQTGLVLSR